MWFCSDPEQVDFGLVRDRVGVHGTFVFMVAGDLRPRLRTHLTVSFDFVRTGRLRRGKRIGELGRRFLLGEFGL